jgi:hypothetical protein
VHNVPVANAEKLSLSLSKEEEMSSEQGFRVPGVPFGVEVTE